MNKEKKNIFKGMNAFFISLLALAIILGFTMAFLVWYSLYLEDKDAPFTTKFFNKEKVVPDSPVSNPGYEALPGKDKG